MIIASIFESMISLEGVAALWHMRVESMKRRARMAPIIFRARHEQVKRQCRSMFGSQAAETRMLGENEPSKVQAVENKKPIQE